MTNTTARLTRRAVLERLSAGTLLALGLWPGALRAGSGSPGLFRFIVVNDTHFLSSECGAWLEGVVAQMKKHHTEFCLHAGDLSEKGERSHLETVKEIFSAIDAPVFPVIGNHDFPDEGGRQNY